jgi:hypothetical protein
VKFKHIFSIIFLFFVFIGINFLALNTLIVLLGLASDTSSLLSYIYIRLNLFPFTVYINNIMISNIINYYTNRCKTDYSLFSLNMFNSITLSNLFFMTCFISLFACLNIDLADYILKADNPGQGNPGGNPGPIEHPGPAENPGPGNPGPVGNPVGNPAEIPEPNMETIRAKAQ